MEPSNSNQIKTRYEVIPPKHIKKAKEILQTGDPLQYIIDTWHRTHVGDDQIGMICCVAIVSTMISNTSGLHIKPSGRSGKGKSDAIVSFLHLLPIEKKLIGSLSGKSLFYKPNLNAGTIIFSDDINLNDDIIATIKQTTSSYQTEYHHTSVSPNLKGKDLTVPARMCWILTSVHGFDDDQMGNRFVSTDVDESSEQDTKVYESQVETECTGISASTVDDTVLVCRAIFQILNKELHHVSIPFVKSIEWGNKDNRRNFPMFRDIMRAITVLNKFQRDSYKNTYLSTINDFNAAKEVYNQVERTNATNLSVSGLKLIDWLKTQGECDIQQLQKYLGLPRSTINVLLNGRVKGVQGGLLSQVPGLNAEMNSKFDERMDRNGNPYSVKMAAKWYYWYDGPLDAKSYTDVVSLNMSTYKESMKSFKETFAGVSL